ncbi:MAG: hypothetical protein ACYS9V_14425 [Planctomycetota bacterium]
MLDGGLVGLFGTPSGFSGITDGQFGAFFRWIDGPVLSCTLDGHVLD